MALKLTVSIIYQTVRHSWLFAAVAVKYVLAAHLVMLARNQEMQPRRFLKEVKSRSDEVVSVIAVAGFLLALLNYQPVALVRPVSEFIALAYFAYLFWSY